MERAMSPIHFLKLVILHTGYWQLVGARKIQFGCRQRLIFAVCTKKCAKTLGASYGDAFLAALAIGQVKRTDIERWNPIAADIRANVNPRYEHNFQIFRDLYDATKAIMKRI